MQNEVCHGECLFGKCPNKTCVKYAAGSGGVAAHNENMRILTAAGLPAHTPDKAGYGFVADIGTTTVVVYLYSLGDSKLLGVKKRAKRPDAVWAGCDFAHQILRGPGRRAFLPAPGNHNTA